MIVSHRIYMTPMNKNPNGSTSSLHLHMTPSHQSDFKAVLKKTWLFVVIAKLPMV